MPIRSGFTLGLLVPTLTVSRLGSGPLSVVGQNPQLGFQVPGVVVGFADLGVTVGDWKHGHAVHPAGLTPAALSVKVFRKRAFLNARPGARRQARRNVQ